MSKAVRWQLPFCSLKGVQYRVDIYDENDDTEVSNENENWPVQLQGGATPFVTDEDNSDDVFEPVRTQSGQLNVLDSGTLIFTLIPQNNTARPVRLVRVSDSAVMWQGFLSCEAYSQPYNARVKEVSLSLISTIEAADSVKLPNGTASRLITIREAIAVALKAIAAKLDNQMYGYVYWPKASADMMNKYIDMTAFYETEEVANEHTHTYELRGQSAKQLLETICRFAGWTLREYGKDIYFTEPTAAIGLKRWLFTDFVNGSAFAPADIAYKRPSIEWRGTGHTMSVRQGARSVKIEAEVKNYDIAPSLPDTPSGASTVRTHHYTDHSSESEVFYYMSALNAINSYSNISHYFWLSNDGDVDQTTVNAFLTNLNTYGYASNYSYREGGTTKYVYIGGSLLGRFYVGDHETQAPDTQDCLFVWMATRSYNKLFTVQTATPLRGMTGAYLCIKPGIKCFLDATGGVVNISDIPEGETRTVYMQMQYGSEYWNGNSWSSDASSRFQVQFNKDGIVSNWDSAIGVSEEDGIFVPVFNDQRGVLALSVLDMQSGNNKTIVFSDLSVELALPYDASAENGTNHYYQALDNGYSEDVSVQLGMATILDNLPSPSLLMDNASTYASTINYKDADGNTTAQRPEKNLLERMASYYMRNRTIRSVEIARPEYNLPEVRYGTGTFFFPLAESMDWKTDVCTLKMFEI